MIRPAYIQVDSDGNPERRFAVTIHDRGFAKLGMISGAFLDIDRKALPLRRVYDRRRAYDTTRFNADDLLFADMRWLAWEDPEIQAYNLLNPGRFVLD